MLDSHSSGDAPALRRAAHTLKSQAAVFGAGRLVAASSALESAANEAVPDLSLVQEVVTQATDVEAVVRQFV